MKRIPTIIVDRNGVRTAYLERRPDPNQQPILTMIARAPGQRYPRGDAARGSEGAPASRASGPAASQWRHLVGQYVASGMSNQQAVSRVNREHPGLRERMVQEHNVAHGRR